MRGAAGVPPNAPQRGVRRGRRLRASDTSNSRCVLCVLCCAVRAVQVAVKILKRSDEIALGDFRTEIAILRKIHHPNTTQVSSPAPRWRLRLRTRAPSATRFAHPRRGVLGS